MRPPPAALSPETLSPPNSAILRPDRQSDPIVAGDGESGAPSSSYHPEGAPRGSGRAGGGGRP